MSRHLKGELNRNDLFQKLNSAIHQFAKKQDTWLFSVVILPLEER